MQASLMSEFAAVVGIDWADRKHAVCLLPAGSSKREWSVLPHRPEAIAQWAEELHQRFGGRPIAVCVELAKGPLVYALQRYAFLVLFPINPTTLAKYRQTFHVSGAKDDPSDAQLALELLLTHPEKFTALRPQRTPVRMLQQLVEQRRMLVDDVRRLTNRITNALKQYFPQPLEWFKDKDTLVFCDFLTAWPTLKHAQRAREARLSAFFHQHNVRYPHIVEARIQAIKSASALTEDLAVIESNRLLVEVLVAQLRALLEAVERYEQQIAKLVPTLPDYALFSSLPGAGPTFAPRLLAAFGEQRERYVSADEIQKYAGVAPVTERSGNKAGCAGACSVQSSCVRPSSSGPPCPSHTATGPKPTTSSSALAFKWIRVVYRCWHSRTPYDEATYLAALKRRKLPLMD